MLEYLFPTGYHQNNQWDVMMAQKWVDSKKPYLTFAFNNHFPHTLPRQPFWLFIYYIKSKAEDPRFKGKLRYRFHVIDWAAEPFSRADTFFYRSTEDFRIWFLCDRGEKVIRKTGEILAYEDFIHAEGKSLASSLRSSIAPVICQAEIKVIEQYP